MSELISAISNAMVDFITNAGYFGVAFLMFIDAANIPAPSEVTLAFAGYLVSTGRLTFWWAVIVSSLAYTSGATFSYWLGYRGGRPFVQKYGKFVFITKRDIELADKLFAKYGSAIAFFSRFVPVLRTFISLPAGIARMPLRKFIPYTFLGALGWSLLFIWLGMKFGENYELIREKFHGIDKVIIVVVILAIIAWVARFFIHRRHERHEAAAQRLIEK